MYRQRGVQPCSVPRANSGSDPRLPSPSISLEKWITSTIFPLAILARCQLLLFVSWPTTHLYQIPTPTNEPNRFVRHKTAQLCSQQPHQKPTRTAPIIDS